MKEGQHSRTAEAAAAIRANHYLNAHDPVFADPYAFDFTSTGWQTLLRSSVLTRLMNTSAANRTLGLLTGQVVGRSRFAEDLLQAAVARGVEQYVLVGAGLDSFSLRQGDDYPDLAIFEVDHPDTQGAKRLKLDQFGCVPDNVELVGINFEIEAIADALARSRYQQDKPGFYSWLGTTHYLTLDATLGTLRSIADFAASGSEVVLDYSVPYQQLAGIERIGSRFVSEFTRALKEPLIGQILTTDLHQAVAQMGYEIVEDLSGKAQNQRYFSHRADHIRTTAATHLLHLKLL